MAKREIERLGSLRYLPLVGVDDQGRGFGALKAMYQTVMEIDQVIFRFAQALEAVQPPAPGKISIRFLRRQWGETDSRHPTFVQWYKAGASERWLYNRLKPAEVLRRLKSYSAFTLTREDAKDLLTQTRTLVEMHEKLWESIGKANRTLAMHAAKAKKAAEPYGPIIEELLPKLEKRRSEIIMGVREAKAFAVEELHDEAMADASTMPRTHPKGRTRGSKTLTRPRSE